MLHKVRHYDYYRGIHVECYTDGYAYDAYNELYLLSVVGHDSAAKGVTAAAVSGREIEILTERTISVYAARYENYRILSTKLPSGLLHQIVAVENFFTQEGTSKIIYVAQGQNIPQVLYHKIQQSYTVPAIPQWAEWLYKKLIEYECITELKGTVKALKLDAHEKGLDELVSEGIKNKEITFTERSQKDVGTDNQRNRIPQNLWQ